MNATDEETNSLVCLSRWIQSIHFIARWGVHLGSTVLILGLCLTRVSSMALAENLPTDITDGKILFHRYSSYDAWDSHLYIYDLQNETVQCISDEWPIDHAMNGHVSPDGKSICFMGVPSGRHSGKHWDIFLWKIGSGHHPTNLTEGNNLRDEDPKFSPDGKSIVFKQEGRIHFIRLQHSPAITIAPLVGLPPGEWSMPYFTHDQKQVVAMTGAGESGDIFLLDIDDRIITPVANEPNVQEYYPIVWDSKRILYTRWHSASNFNDQIYLFNLNTKTNQPIGFCENTANYSDPFPVNETWILFSSTREDNRGGYDLYFGDTLHRRVIRIDSPAVNTANEELGSCFFR